jgi:dipeptidyl aminopeptidase/acylaminoacyl peptidase
VAEAEFSPADGDGRLIYVCDVGGNEKLQLKLLSADGASEIALTAGYEDARHTFGAWSSDGTRVLFAANRRRRDLFDLYVQPLDGEAHLVWQNSAPGYLVNMRFAPGDSRGLRPDDPEQSRVRRGRVCVTRTASSFNHALFEIDLATGTARRLISQEEGVRYLAAHYAPDGQTLFVTTDLDSDFLYIARLDLQTGALVRLVEPEADCEALTLSPDGNALAYAVNVEGGHRIHLLDLTTGAVRDVPDLDVGPGLIPDGHVTFSPDSRHLAFAFTSATRSSDIFVWDLEHDQVQAVTHVSHGGIPVTSFIAPSHIHYPTFDQDEGTGQPRQIPAWFYEPAGERDTPAPAIIMVHGGPEGQFRPRFNATIAYFVHHGYAVLAPNVRGSTGYGKAYSHLDDVEKRMDSVADLAHAAHWLRARPDIDGERLVVYGGSYGGFMVLAALTHYPNLWAAGVNIVGISNLATFLENTSGYRRAHREAEYGSLARDRAFLERIAPINHVDNINVPLMVIHGANDPRVPLSEAEQLVAALEERNVPVEFLVFDDEGHGIVKLKNKLVAYPEIVTFLEEYV